MLGVSSGSTPASWRSAAAQFPGAASPNTWASRSPEIRTASLNSRSGSPPNPTSGIKHTRHPLLLDELLNQRRLADPPTPPHNDALAWSGGPNQLPDLGKHAVEQPQLAPPSHEARHKRLQDYSP